jgi:hypothetical protein
MACALRNVEDRKVSWQHVGAGRRIDNSVQNEVRCRKSDQAVDERESGVLSKNVKTLKMTNVKVKFENYERDTDIGRIIAQAVNTVVNGTPHSVLYDVTENDVVERKGLKSVRTHRAVRLELTVKIPVDCGTLSTLRTQRK